MVQPFVEVQNLIFRYDHVEVLHEISFSLNKGEIVGLLGPNGAGKSTTIKVMAGILSATSGRVQVAGSASARWIKWTSHVSGKAETIFTPDRFNPLYTILEFSTETGMAADSSTNTYNVDEL